MNDVYQTDNADGPKTATRRMGYLRSVFRYDLSASFVVFLIAIPLSLGIASASGAPLIAGLVAAVVGGIVAGALGGSPLQVSGPAAGMTLVVAGLVDEYGWPATAGITLAAGLVQILLGAFKIGRIALSLSPAVVLGMLAGIGVTIVIGQLHVLLGDAADGSVLANLRELPSDLIAPHWNSTLIGVVTIGTMLLWPKLPGSKVLPGPLAAVAVGTLLAFLGGFEVPKVTLPDDPLANLTLPTVPGGSPAAIALAVVTVALVASIESLLSAVAVDKQHSGPRSNLDRELIGQGAANAVSGAFGGLPVTGVIVRSSTNVAAGARTRVATVLHGIWIAVFVLALGNVLELIPMAALAGILIVIGSRLITIEHVRKLRKHGEFAVYWITACGVFLLGLMEGVLLGLAVAAALALYRLTHYSVQVAADETGGWRATVHGSLVFLGVGKLVRELRLVPHGQRVVLELHVDFMDHAAFEAIDDWRTSYERTGGHVTIEEYQESWYDRARNGEPGRRKTLPAPLPRWFAPWAQWRQRRGEPATNGGRAPGRCDDAESILAGLHEFERRSAPFLRPFLAELAEHGQRPQQLFITCADSRVVPNLITSTGPGDQFCVRNIGNLVPVYQSEGSIADSSVGAAVEFAIDVLKVPTIVVCGHSHCGAMKALAQGTSPPGSRLHTWLRNGKSSLDRLHKRPPDRHDRSDDPNGEYEPLLNEVDRLCVANVAQQVDNLRSYPVVRAAEDAGRVRLVGMFFDLAQAKSYLVDPSTGQLVRLPTPAR